MVEKVKKLQARYSLNVSEEDLIGRVMGPDEWGAMYYVVAVMRTDTHTVANFMPLTPDIPIKQNPFDMSGFSRRVGI